MNSKNSETNKVKEDMLATIRAVTLDDSVQIDFSDHQSKNFFDWKQNIIISKNTAILPQVKAGDSSDKLLKRHRASLDLASSYILFHDKELHQEQSFISEEQQIFDDFEKVRVISNVKDQYLGIANNLLDKIEDDIFYGSQNLSLLLLEEIFGSKLPLRTQNAIDEIKPQVSARFLDGVKKAAQNISNQTNFAKDIKTLIDLLRQEQEAEEKEQKEQESNSKQQDQTQEDVPSFGSEDTNDSQDDNDFSQDLEEESPKKEEQKTEKISDIQDDDKGGEASIKSGTSRQNDDEIEFKNSYKIYSSKFDEVVYPQKIIAKQDLDMLRDQLDIKLSNLSGISKKMSLRLKRKLLSKRNTFLERDSSRGILDRKKLSRIAIDPLIEDIWINNKNHEYQDTALTILLDNSGSMRGNPIVMSAMACEIIASILEKFSVKTEIIGFTTADWKGGRARKLWESSGRPKNPGRLNELRHIVYKHFNQSFKKAKTNLGLMLKEGILKENIDGEALLFAKSRIMQQNENRKIVMVISDGTPVDDSTSSTNDSDILSDHLHSVINKIEKQSNIEIVGIGIGHTTEEFYKNSITIKSLEELGDAMIEKITNLL